jgi:hypothetical protein
MEPKVEKPLPQNCLHCYCLEVPLVGEQKIPHLRCCRCDLTLAMCYVLGAEGFLKWKASTPKPS